MIESKMFKSTFLENETLKGSRNLVNINVFFLKRINPHKRPDGYAFQPPFGDDNG